MATKGNDFSPKENLLRFYSEFNSLGLKKKRFSTIITMAIRFTVFFVIAPKLLRSERTEKENYLIP